jgi:hypothetical protein
MCQSVLHEPAFFALLLRIDQDHAAEVCSQRCPCGGPLHQSNYERKPRGGLVCCGADSLRLSFCCGICRRRCTPRSVRFLGRRVYWGAMVVLATALCSGLNLRRGQQLSEQLGAPVRTIRRWREWWLTRFTASAFWLDLKGRFLPPIAAPELPAALLRRAAAVDDASALTTVLRWITPLSTITEGR